MMKAQVRGDPRRLDGKPEIYKSKEIQAKEPKKTRLWASLAVAGELEKEGPTVDRKPRSTWGGNRWARGDHSGVDPRCRGGGTCWNEGKDLEKRAFNVSRSSNRSWENESPTQFNDQIHLHRWRDHQKTELVGKNKNCCRNEWLICPGRKGQKAELEPPDQNPMDGKGWQNRQG